MGFPGTLLAWILLPLWLLKAFALKIRRFQLGFSTRHRWFDEVDPAIVVGGALFPGDLEALRAIGVGAILSLCAEYLDDEAACAAAGVTALRIPVHDDLGMRGEDLVAALDWIDARVAEKRKVYVHCAAGRGRSVAVVCGWLVRARGLGTDEAVARIKAVRPAAGPRSWQLAPVRALEARLRG
jgi:protein-tyrosine phosphatase